MSNTLEDRVNKFNALALPGQSQMMHMGTSYLVNDLWRENAALRERLDEAEKILRHLWGFAVAHDEDGVLVLLDGDCVDCKAAQAFMARTAEADAAAQQGKE